MNPKVIELAQNELDSKNLDKKVKKLLEICKVWSKTPETIGGWIDRMNINDEEDEIIEFLIHYPQMKKALDMIFGGELYEQSVINSNLSWFMKNASKLSNFNKFIQNSK